VLTYGPFKTSAAASIGFCSIADRKYGKDIGVAWMEGTTTQLFRPPVTRPDGRTDMLIIEGHGPVRPPPPASPFRNAVRADGKIAWDGAAVAADAVGVVLAYAAIPAAYALATSAAAGLGSAALVIFAAVELADAAAMFYEDDRMFWAEVADRRDKTNRNVQALEKDPVYNMVSAWGPIIALPNIARDIIQFRKFLNVARDLDELSVQVKQRLKDLVPSPTVIQDFALIDRIAFLSAAAKQLTENAEDIAGELRVIQRWAGPADLLGLANSVIHFSDIRDGIEGSFSDWMNDVDGWLSPNAWFEAHPGSSFPYNAHEVAFRNTMNGFGSEKVHTSTYYLTMHVMTGKAVKRK
jgi:hypothetical protein